MQVLEQTRSWEQVSDFAAGTFDYPLPETPTFQQEAFDTGARSQLAHQALFAIGLPMTGRDLELEPLQDLAPGVHAIGGSRDNSLVVVQRDGVVVVDAPVAPERSLRMADVIALRCPELPITHLVQSHFHSTVLEDPERALRLLPLAGDPHASDMLLASVISDGLVVVFVADILVTGAPGIVPGGAQSFVSGLREYGLLDEACRSDMPTLALPAHGPLTGVPLPEVLEEIADARIDVGCPASASSR